MEYPNYKSTTTYVSQQSTRCGHCLSVCDRIDGSVFGSSVDRPLLQLALSSASSMVGLAQVVTLEGAVLPNKVSFMSSTLCRSISTMTVAFSDRLKNSSRHEVCVVWLWLDSFSLELVTGRTREMTNTRGGKRPSITLVGVCISVFPVSLKLFLCVGVAAAVFLTRCGRVPCFSTL